MGTENIRYCDDRGMIKSQVYASQCGCNKLDTFNWMRNLAIASEVNDVVEIRFKNTRKGIYRNVNTIRLKKGDIVAVEASPGHDIGIVSLTGELVLHQMKKNDIPADSEDLKKIYRKAKPVDIDKWKEAIDREHPTMIRTRRIAEDLELIMKISDVEFQGDNTKAIFYYIADERVDFRELIKILADEFKVRIEMKQIGARQEAGRIGGISSCGRELCCASWINNFVSVTTNAARYQELSLNPQKLAGQCGKLKCCLNYEVHSYLDAQKDFPDKSIILQTEKGPAYHQKTDIYRQIMWYGFEKENSVNPVPVPVERVKEIIGINSTGEVVKDLLEHEEVQAKGVQDYTVGMIRDNPEDKNTTGQNPLRSSRRNKKRKR
jgi:cell fate regulator YaaT (PSP1 superfamily)